MIYVVKGKVGSGKSLLTLTFALEHLGRGGCVFSNVALNEPRVDELMWSKYKRRLVHGQIRFHDFEAQPEFQLVVPWGLPDLPVMVIVDEAQLYYNAIDAIRLSVTLKRLLSFLTQSRKACVDVWFVTQHDTTIWAQFRHQALFGYKCRDMRQVSLPFVGQLPSLGLTWVKYDIMTDEPLESGKTPLDRRIFGLYDTRQMFDSQMIELRKSAEIWNPPSPATLGKYETPANSRNRLRWPRRIWNLCLQVVSGQTGNPRGSSEQGDAA